MDVDDLLAPEARIQVRADALDEGRRLDRVLHARVAAWASRVQVTAWIRAGRATVDGRTVRRAGRPVKWGERLDLVAPKTPQDLAAEEWDPASVPRVHRGDGFLVVDKPAGLAAHPARGQVKRTLLVALHRRYAAEAEPGGPWLCHRLDRDTSGLLVAALTREALGRFTALFAAGAIERRYAARVHGHPPWVGPTRLCAPLRLQDEPPYRVVVDEAGQSAETVVEVVGAAGATSDLRVAPITGRQHQIRVHLAHAGYPLVGDPFYGPPGDPAPRMYLHAETLCLPDGTRIHARPPWTR